jgi:hypothetical protein
VQRSERKVATDERTRDGATHRVAHDQHFFHRHFELIGMAQTLKATVSPTETKSTPPRSAIAAIGDR